MYNQTGILRTIEAILGLNPMTQFDASSRTMFGGFSSQPDTKPYRVEKPHVSLTDRNPANGPGAKDSAKMDFSVADDIDDDKLNDILWWAIRKTDFAGSGAKRVRTDRAHYRTSILSGRTSNGLSEPARSRNLAQVMPSPKRAAAVSARGARVNDRLARRRGIPSREMHAYHAGTNRFT